MSAGIKRKGFLVMMKFFQKLGKSLMLPVACLPVCGILMGIGYILAPAAMAGEVQGFTAGGLSYSIGLFLIKAGGALIDNMSWLFAVGVGVGMADDSDGTAGLAGLVSMYMITTLLSPGVLPVLPDMRQRLHLVRSSTSSLVFFPVLSVLHATTNIRLLNCRMHWHSSAAREQLQSLQLFIP